MIYGDTTLQKYADDKAKRIKLSKKQKWFCWYSVQLDDGRFVWWQYVYRWYEKSEFRYITHYELIKVKDK